MEARQSVADNTTPHSGVPHLSVRVHVFNDTSAVLRINFKQLPMLPNEVLEECLEHACWGTLVEAKATSRAWREAATAVLRRRRRLVSRVLVHPAQRQHLPTVWLEAALRNQPLDKFLADTREVILRGTRWELHARYAVKKYRSSSGLHEIVKAVDRATDVRVDVHRIHGAFGCPHDAMRLANELELLTHFRHANLVSLYDLTLCSDGKGAQEVLWVSARNDVDLRYVIHSTQSLSHEHHQYLIYQLFRGLACLHAAGVIHADLKPSNLLVNRDCTLQIGNLSCARPPDKELPAHVAHRADDYVVVRWYRAPELLLEQTEAVAPPIDIYAAGTIAAELWLRKPLLPGRDYLQQIRLYKETMIGTFEPRHYTWVSNPQAVAYLKQLPSKPRSFEQRFADAPPELTRLLEATLEWDAAERLDANGVLAHDWFAPIVQRVGPAEDWEALVANEQTRPPPFEWRRSHHVYHDERSEAEIIAACQGRVRAVARSFHDAAA